MALVASRAATLASRCCSAKDFCGPRVSFLVARNLHGWSPACAAPFVTSRNAGSEGRSRNPSRRLMASATAITTATPGRSRKRPRPSRRHRQPGGSLLSDGVSNGGIGGNSNEADPSPSPSPTIKSANNPAISESRHRDDDDIDDDDSSLPYPRGKPWRVLWPRPHGEPDAPDWTLSGFRNRIPTMERVRRAWSLYKTTWEDGITGIPTKRNNDEDGRKQTDDGLDGVSDDPSTGSSKFLQQQHQLQDIGDNAANNLRIVRKDAQDILERTKETTGIHTQDDVKALASEAMKIATECIREFMAGYREGRDSEIDKMLHEYFQEQDDEDNSSWDNKVLRTNSNDGPEHDNTNSTEKNAMETAPPATSSVAKGTGRRKKRKPKRGIPRE